MSVGVMADCATNTRYGTIKGDRAIMPNTKKVISNGENFNGEKSKVEGVTASFNMNQNVVPEQVKSAETTKTVYERRPTSSTIGLPNQTSNLLFSTGRLDKSDEVLCAPQLFSNQASNTHSSSYNQKKIHAITSKRKRKKDGIPERIENVTLSTAQEVLESDKPKQEDKRNTTENKTENLRTKLCQILGTTSSPEERLPPEQRFDQEDKFNKAKPNYDTIEADYKNPDHNNRRPVTRSWSRQRASVKMKPSKSKSGSSSRDKEKHQVKSIFSFEERWTGGPSTFVDDDSLMSLRSKSHRKNSGSGRRKICFPENDATDKLCQITTDTNVTTPQGEEIFSFGNKRGSHFCLSDHQKESPQSQKIIQEKESFQSPTIKKADQHQELESSENGNQQNDVSNPVVEDVAGPQINFQSPTFRLKTLTLNSTRSSTPETDVKASDVGSPVSTETERRFILGAIHSLRTSKTLEPGYNKQRTQRQSSDIEELIDSLPRKAASFVKEKEAQDGRSDSSSEETDFQGSQEGSRERNIAEKQTVTLNPTEKLPRNESIKFNNNHHASPSSKGRTSIWTGENDWANEASEQNQEDGFVRAMELFVLELGKVKSKLKSVTSQKSSEILISVAEEIHLQLQNVHFQIQTDMGKLTNLSKSKRKRLETSFEGHQKQLRLIHEKFMEKINLHLRDCRSTVLSFEADQMEIKGVVEKQRASHRRLLSQVEEAMEIQFNDAQRKITGIQEAIGKGKTAAIEACNIYVFERRYGNDFVELVWKNGQIVVQGGSSSTSSRRGPCITKRARLNTGLYSLVHHQNSQQTHRQPSYLFDFYDTKSNTKLEHEFSNSRETKTTSPLCSSSSHSQSQKHQDCGCDERIKPTVFLKSGYGGVSAADHSLVIDSSSGANKRSHSVNGIEDVEKTCEKAKEAVRVGNNIIVAKSDEKKVVPDQQSEAIKSEAECGNQTHKSKGKLAANEATSPSLCSLGASNNPSTSRKHVHEHEDTDDSNYITDNEEEDVITETPSREGSRGKRSRNAATHNLSERKRRDKINKKMRALKELIPNCNKMDKASMLDDAIDYLKTLKFQLQAMSMGCMAQMMVGGGHHLMGSGMSLRPSGIGIPYSLPPPQFPIPNMNPHISLHNSITDNININMLGFPNHHLLPIPFSMSPPLPPNLSTLTPHSTTTTLRANNNSSLNAQLLCAFQASTHQLARREKLIPDPEGLSKVNVHYNIRRSLEFSERIEDVDIYIYIHSTGSV
ncbi:Meiosis-specific protein ASY3 [Senna tora]|uniref:Meiosis-specific protein ASY3 n=1 Tax=Senna tora TaxID=362788 RepID=A0A834W105_9FABA|nr:Meiosis-specific protein ASY3 [Senna tora]